MKTPREVLLARHQSIVPELDRLRRETIERKVAAPKDGGSPVSRITSLLWSELFAPCKGVWGGLAGVWIVLAALYLSQAGGNEKPAAREQTSVAVVQKEFEDRQALLAKLLDERPPEQPSLYLPPQADIRCRRTVPFA